MIAHHVSAASTPEQRGEELGAAYAGAIAETVDRYGRLFAKAGAGSADLRAIGEEALVAIEAYWPAAAAEVAGIAGGADVHPREIAMLNARTEILARLGAEPRAECSTIVVLGEGRAPLSVQTWDWHDLFAGGWFVWTIERDDGPTVHTVTEYGILAKIGVNSRGVGLHLNILHHRSDGGPIGAPVHVLARRVLETATDAGQAVATLGAAETSASSALTLVAAGDAGATALTAEVSPDGPRFVLPSPSGLLIHTNHFLDVHLAAGDREPRLGPDSFVRMDVLRRTLTHDRPSDRDELLRLLTSHVGGPGAVCCHPDPSAPLGERWKTLAVVAIDVEARTLAVREGNPCDTDAQWLSLPTPLEIGA